ncbi:hypothetical protein [Actinoplanes sp. NPDC051411]|uniref:hypothetical protein n=1 Tax=Actinoplanes sp. NPDC051411 TaxID=3155522 RepID=UPI00342B3006
MAGNVFRARAMPARTAGIRPDQVRDVLDVRDDAVAALTVLALIARMLRELLTDRPDRGYPLSAAAITVGAVKVALPMRCGRLGRACPLPADPAVVATYETAVARVLTALDDIDPPPAPVRARRRPPSVGKRAGSLGGLRKAVRATDLARTAAQDLSDELYAIAVDVCGFDLSELVVDELELIEGFVWDSTTRWPRPLVDPVFARSVFNGDGTMMVRAPAMLIWPGD